MDKLDQNEAKDILAVQLTKTEFAEALGLRINSVFMDNIFSHIDKESKGYVSFREFLDTIFVFAKGKNWKMTDPRICHSFGNPGGGGGVINPENEG